MFMRAIISLGLPSNCGQFYAVLFSTCSFLFTFLVAYFRNKRDCSGVIGIRRTYLILLYSNDPSQTYSK